MLSLLAKQVVQLSVNDLNGFPLDAYLVAIGQFLRVFHVFCYIFLLCHLKLESLEDIDEGLQLSLLEVIPVDYVAWFVHVITAVCQNSEQVNLAVAGAHLAFEVEQHQAIVTNWFSLNLVLRFHDQPKRIWRIFIHLMVALHPNDRAWSHGLHEELQPNSGLALKLNDLGLCLKLADAHES